MSIILNTDGACFGNPGPTGVGFVLRDGDSILEQHSSPAGIGTNNQAEYNAVIAGLESALAHGVENLEVRLDSELVVRQIEGRYKVRDQQLAVLKRRVDGLVARFATVGFTHVRREFNAAADALAKAGAEVQAGAAR